jgi:hypothetical protein
MRMEALFQADDGSQTTFLKESACKNDYFSLRAQMTSLANATIRMLSKVCINTLIVVIALTVTLVAAEFATRFVMRDITSTANLQTWYGSRWKENHVTLNSLGYRDTEVPPLKSAETFRIAVMGDSFAFGVGIPAEERFSNLLGADLGSGCNLMVEVYNFSKPGLNTVQEIEVLRRDVLPLQPDAILLQWLPNDVEDYWQGMVQATPPMLLPLGAHKWLIKNTALYYHVYQASRSISIGTSQNVSYEDRLISKAGEPGSKEWLEHRQNILEFIKIADNAGINTSIILFPLFTKNPQLGYRMLPVHSIAQSACELSSAECLDLLDTYENATTESDFSEFWVNRLDSHPGKQANRLAADAILENMEWNTYATANGTQLACDAHRAAR